MSEFRRRLMMTKVGGGGDSYVDDGLILWIDAPRQKADGLSHWIDYSGEGYSITDRIDDFGVTQDKYIDLYRYSFGVPLVQRISNEFTIEVVFQSKWTNYDRVTINDTVVTGPLILFSNSEYLLRANGTFKIPGVSGYYGSEVIDRAHIVHFTLSWDGTEYKRYVDGVLDTTITGVFNVSSYDTLYVLGYRPWNGVTRACYNNVRIYNRELTAEEIASNYDLDITRFGTVNIETS